MIFHWQQGHDKETYVTAAYEGGWQTNGYKGRFSIQALRYAYHEDHRRNGFVNMQIEMDRQQAEALRSMLDQMIEADRAFVASKEEAPA